MGFINMIKMFDLYQAKVTLTYNGKSSFKTLFGALISIVIMLTVLLIFGVLVYWIVLKSKPQQASTRYSKITQTIAKCITLLKVMSTLRLYKFNP